MNLAIITGASKGIGRQTAQFFVDNEWSVISLSRTKPDNDAIGHIEVDLKDFNVTDLQDELIPLLQQATKISLIHCAAIIKSDSIETVDEQVLRDTMEINVFSVIKLAQFLIPHMPKDSSIILVGSNLSYMGIPDCCSYIVSKHALLGLMRSMTQDLAYKGIHSCCICPGCVNTDMLKGLAKSRNSDVNDYKSFQLFNRFVEPMELAKYIYFCSENPVVNGGVMQATLG